MLGSNNSNGDSSGITNQPTTSSTATLAAAAPSPLPQQPSSHDGGLVPSQTINRTRSGSGSATSANRNRNGTQQRQQQEQQQEQPQSKGDNKNNNDDDDKNKNRNKKGNSNNRNRNRNRNQQQQQRQREQLQHQKSSSIVVAGTVTSTTEVQDEDQKKPSTNKKKSNNNRRNRPPQQQRKNNNRQRQRRQRQRYPWRKDIPDEAVDPITLESLHTLPYPPFALYAEIPYQTIPVWPISEEDDVVVDNNNDTSKSDAGALQEETEAQRQQRILQEQWGDQLMTSPSPPSAAASSSPPISGAVSEEDTTTTTMSTPPPSNSKQRHVHLYDGRALAYYMVSQLQFIDPLNRRDLVRDEIVNLDRYLRRHGFANLNVTEAYDAKGITISTAGAAGNTAAGRATILQQEAAILLNALFGGGGPSTTNLPNRPSSSSGAGGSRNMNNSLMQSYQAHEYRQEQQRLRQEQQRDHSHHPQSQEATSESPDDWDVYGDERGILVIDDDLNPGLRGNQTARLRGEAAEFVPGTTASSTAPYTIWSSSRIAARFPRQSAEPRAVDFPALAPAAGAADAASTNKKKALLKSNTLAKIAVSVKKTDPEERQRMYMAHDAWRRRAIMSNLTFGVDPMVSQQQQQESQAVQMTANAALAAAPPAEPTEAQLERNRAFALALNVKPSTIRQQQQQTTGGRSSTSGSLKSGWARPTTSGGGVETLLDEFGKELNPSSAAANYPDELIVEARDRLPLLSKLERRWKLFLEDDKAASLPLWPMDRPTRTFVHQYSDFWRLKTESFDPEPKRYIHCVKLLDTRAPSVLLSDATRQWKGPQQDHQRHELIDLMDLPRSSKGSSNDHYSQQTAGQATEAPSSSSLRWNALRKSDDDDKELLFMERPRLDLQKRTLPLELPPYQPPSDSNNSYFTSQERKLRQERMEEKAPKEREQVEDQRRLLEAAFASDDDDDNNGGPTATKRAMSDDDSEWTEEEEQYQGGSSDED